MLLKISPTRLAVSLVMALSLFSLLSISMTFMKIQKIQHTCENTSRFMVALTPIIVSCVIFTVSHTSLQVVLVCTSATELQGHPTGLWIEELACPYYLFKEQGYEIVIASPAGGPVPIDGASLGEGFFTEEAKKFMVC